MGSKRWTKNNTGEVKNKIDKTVNIDVNVLIKNEPAFLHKTRNKSIQPIR